MSPCGFGNGASGTRLRDGRPDLTRHEGFSHVDGQREPLPPTGASNSRPLLLSISITDRRTQQAAPWLPEAMFALVEGDLTQRQRSISFGPVVAITQWGFIDVPQYAEQCSKHVHRRREGCDGITNPPGS